MGESSFWYRPTRVVPDQRPLNGRCCCRHEENSCFLYDLLIDMVSFEKQNAEYSCSVVSVSFVLMWEDSMLSTLHRVMDSVRPILPMYTDLPAKNCTGNSSLRSK